MVLAEPKTIHSLKELENKLSAPTGDPDKNAYRYNSGKGYESYDLMISFSATLYVIFFAIHVLPDLRHERHDRDANCKCPTM